MYLPWSTNVGIHKAPLIVRNCLHYDEIVSIAIVIVRGTLCRTNDRNMISMNDTNSLWKSPAGFKICSNIPEAGTCWEINILRKQVFCNSITGLMTGTHTVDRPIPSNADKVRYSAFAANFHRVTATVFSTLTWQSPMCRLLFNV